jgi:hypothetical protein
MTDQPQPEIRPSKSCEYLKKLFDLYKRVNTAVPYDFESITVSTTAKTLNPLKSVHATKAFITVEAQPIRVRYDGITPTATEGHLYAAATTIILTNKTEIINFMAIRQGASDATLKITYYAPEKDL